MILMIDNYDSFTYNLVQYMSELGANVVVRRNDKVTVDEVIAMHPERIVISPGPGTPDEAGISLALVAHFINTNDDMPIFGVCLGHQTLAQAYGGKVVHAGTIMHGKTSLIHHNGKGLYAGIPNPFRATRYHSLAVEKESLPDCFEITAWTETEDGTREEIMGVRHKTRPFVGAQFHPESILTDCGMLLLGQFLKDEL